MRSVLARTSCLAALLTASPAMAADYVLGVGPGTTSTDFGASATQSGTLDDRYFFTIPAGSTNGFVGSIALTDLLDVDLDDVSIDDDIAFTQIASDGIELWTLDATAIAAGTHFIHIVGSWGDTGGSYAGTLNFAPNAVPEPATWGLMILGFGALGGALRRRSTKVGYTA